MNSGLKIFSTLAIFLNILPVSLTAEGIKYKVTEIPSDLLKDAKAVVRKLVSKFGEYTSEILSDNKSIIYIRSFKLFDGDYPVTDYPEFVDFFEKISLSDESKIALIK